MCGAAARFSDVIPAQAKFEVMNEDLKQALLPCPMRSPGCVLDVRLGPNKSNNPNSIHDDAWPLWLLLSLPGNLIRNDM